MATSVFQNPYKKAPQAWSAQQAQIMWNSSKGGSSKPLGALSGISITFSRSVTPLYPVGGSAPIQVVGIPQGSLTMNTLIGPTSELEEFLKALSSACDPMTITIRNTSQESECGNAAVPQEVTCVGCVGVAVSYGISNQGGMSMATGGFQLQFTDMKWASL